jgi:hypothetical protein
MDPTGIIFAACTILAGLIGYGYVRTLFAKRETHAMELPYGHTYTYVIGDYQRLYGSRGYFHGIDVILPAELPHIYLDSLQGGGHQVRFIIDPAQRIQLEGDFKRYYNVFVPQAHAAIALSILSPDVMVALEDYATAFDVEIYGNHLRIICNRPVAHSRTLQDKLLYVALKLMAEIDHRLSSWSDADSRAAHDQDLRIYPARGVRLYGRYVTYAYFGWLVYWALVCVGLLAGGVIALLDPAISRRLGVGLLAAFGVVFGVLVVYTRRNWRAARFRSRKQ